MSGTHRHLAPDRQGLLLTFGIGLTDVVKGQSGMDREVDFRGSDRAGLAQKIARFRPGVLCFNGKRAAGTTRSGGEPNDAIRGLVVRDVNPLGSFRQLWFWSRDGLVRGYDIYGVQPGPRLVLLYR